MVRKDLDQFQGLDQIGEQGLKDKVNNHYFQIFGTSIASGVVAGASQITQGWRHQNHERLPGVHERGCRQCFAIRGEHS